MASDDDHRHCKVCGKVCGVGDDTCSPSCRTRRELLLRTRRNYTWAMYAIIGFVVLVFILNYVH
ncbi:MAG: DUF2116 family Zn-ribbon domain-containing protein [Thermoplasmata archaeon]|nr:DUF2116 family Zn-ribbon domain-containing protein [Thermoplasmata archaeon]